ncbi:hypothetical protein KEJ19_06850, partial [Candidatus Bathyarchaeota archaeon]|nr:hypothetical protein [Candidatus Bathyarchaeota archaeon]
MLDEEKEESRRMQESEIGLKSRFLFDEIPEYGYHLAISAIYDVRIDDVQGFLKDLRKNLHPVRVQAFDARKIAGRLHIYFATLFALKAF